jgi:hypothetical protein
MPIQFNATPAELRIIERIVYRVQLMKIYQPHEGAMCSRDIQAVHSNGCPMRLADLLAADGFTFAHDLCGIKAHLDRDMGKLDLFFPRSARPRWFLPGVWDSGRWTPPKTTPSDAGAGRR